MDVRSGEVGNSDGTNWFGHMLGLSPGSGFKAEDAGIVGLPGMTAMRGLPTDPRTWMRDA